MRFEAVAVGASFRRGSVWGIARGVWPDKTLAAELSFHPKGEVVRIHRTLRLALVAAAAAAAALAITAGPASADYGTGAQYQVEISANNVGGVPGDGVWIWISLNANHTGDYTAADCIHTGSLLGHPGLNGAAHEQGDVTWTDSNNTLTINGIALVGGVFPVTVDVPDSYGHSVLSSDSVITGFALGPIGGNAQVQVAP